MRRVSRLFAALGLVATAVSASACSGLEAPGLVRGPAAGEARPSSAGGDPTEVADMDALGAGAILRGREAPPLPKVKPAPPAAGTAVPAVEASAVVGLSEDQVENLLGRPKSEAVLPPGRVREYVSGGCTLRLYLYVDLKTQLYRVLHLETVSAESGAEKTRHCLTRIARHAVRDREL